MIEKNEIKSFRTKISLKEYLKLHSVISDKMFKVGGVHYCNVNDRVKCQDENNNNCVITLIGKHANKINIYLFEDNYSIIELDIKHIVVYVEVVLKEQIKDLKYVEQLSLFEDGKTGKDSNNE